MLYIESFHFPEVPDTTDNRKTYPQNIMLAKQLKRISFEPITIFYGDNGSGKSTLLNIIADYVRVPHKTDGNRSAYFDDYVRMCKADYPKRLGHRIGEIPADSAFIRSEDILSQITGMRKQYRMMRDCASNTLDRWDKDPDEYIQAQNKLFRKAQEHPASLTDKERDILSRTRDYHFVRVDDLNFESNGESTLKCYKNCLYDQSLFFLDEPEVSLSPAHQSELAYYIGALAYRMESQFIISTHSPFFLSIADALIYDLDASPVVSRKWFELDSMKEYYRLFSRYSKYFEIKPA